MTSTVPGIAIRIGGSTAPTPPASIGGTDVAPGTTYALYLQTTKGDSRRQFVVYPPYTAIGETMPNGAMYRFMERTQQFKGHRTRWNFHWLWDHSIPFVDTFLRPDSENGWTVHRPVLTEIAHDDLREAYAGETPHKFLRAVAKNLEPFGLTIK